ncbi:MAG: glycosyltransferase [Muribaculaceae bacterium]|nr:glycosyltransferase [Muribaculaceae bacterium]
MPLPKISVIVPVYNSEKFLERCVDSILAQTFTDFELILVDDGSVDTSGEICDNYAKYYANISVLHVENSGASIARKIGVKNAKGEYVAFVDSDDYVKGSYLESLFSLIVRYNTRISACGVCCLKNENKQNETGRESDCVLDFDSLMSRFFKYEFWGFPGKLYKKNIFENIIFPVETISEDYYVMAQIFLKEKIMPATDSQLYYYEKHENSLSNMNLSIRSFEEFYNVKNTYNMIKTESPEYRCFALGNAMESCIKLLWQSRYKKKEYRKERGMMLSFLREHLCEILFAKNIYWKYKVVTVKILSGL